MSEFIDAKGLACPEPVIRTKKALQTYNEVTILVDNAAAFENVTRLASSLGCTFDAVEEPGGTFRIHIQKEAVANTEAVDSIQFSPRDTAQASPAGPTVFVLASNIMGYGEDELGAILMKAFVHTATELDNGPDVVILYNTGVKLAAVDSGSVDDLKAMETKGTKILVCGTCVNFFELKDKLGAGTISNMFDIAGTLATAGRIVKP
jgi:selenium metabolism protein YedF